MEVKLRNQRGDFNSVIDVQVWVGRDVYNLWLPAMFINITNNARSDGQPEISKSVYPIKALSSPTEAANVI